MWQRPVIEGVWRASHGAGTEISGCRSGGHGVPERWTRHAATVDTVCRKVHFGVPEWWTRCAGTVDTVFGNGGHAVGLGVLLSWERGEPPGRPYPSMGQPGGSRSEQAPAYTAHRPAPVRAVSLLLRVPSRTCLLVTGTSLPPGGGVAAA
ncbi:hypothetical protein [Kibdelosporangium philippinense]|uniref:hypothetical protein n=1 Tax=Kibdelosporangium philippinense TaxID=211113 RepID=UPI00361DC753